MNFLEPIKLVKRGSRSNTVIAKGGFIAPWLNFETAQPDRITIWIISEEITSNGRVFYQVLWALGSFCEFLKQTSIEDPPDIRKPKGDLKVMRVSNMEKYRPSLIAEGVPQVIPGKISQLSVQGVASSFKDRALDISVPLSALERGAKTIRRAAESPHDARTGGKVRARTTLLHGME